MQHISQSIICPDCNVKFRSNRALRNHQQRFHLNNLQDVPDYNHISSYLIMAFSTEQFPLIAKNACEQRRLPLGDFTSKLFQCKTCLLSFPCSKALTYHRLNKHEQYEYKLCRSIVYDLVLQVEENLHSTANNDIESSRLLLAKHASSFGLIDKELAADLRRIKQEQNKLIFPSCPHQNRTCANLCLENLSSYNSLVRNYPYKIPLIPKGNPFAQGSIVSKPVNKTSTNNSVTAKEGINTNEKRTSLKRVKSSLSDDLSASPQSKRKLLSTVEQQIKVTQCEIYRFYNFINMYLDNRNKN